MHVCGIDRVYGDWRIGDREADIEMSDIYPLLNDENLLEVKFDDIGYKGRDFPPFVWGDGCICCGGERYRNCDYSYPGILVIGMPNPYNKPYSNIDGKHRIMRMISDGLTSAKFHVLTMDDISKYLWFFVEH